MFGFFHSVDPARDGQFVTSPRAPTGVGARWFSFYFSSPGEQGGNPCPNTLTRTFT